MEQFGKLIVSKNKPIFDTIDPGELAEDFRNLLHGVKEPMKVPQLTEEQKFHVRTLGYYHEISSAFEALEHAAIFIESVPGFEDYEGRGITREGYLRYHVEHYLEQNYVLLNRVTGFLDWLKKELYKEGRIQDCERILELKSEFIRCMDNPKQVRGAHVHAERFEDDQLSILGFFELASTISEDEELKLTAILSSELAKEQWSKKIKDNNRDLKKVLDWLFEQLTSVVFPIDQGVTK
ncbi:MAG: hypothetical protein KAX23_05630 [Dehalococcoidia bacterium]|jgi:hypothetical protein|nr:hypothetical protein [Chloroflexota bacterium]MCK4243010.1 hypothetical protein [Dehalococcoidia bacterium]